MDPLPGLVRHLLWFDAAGDADSEPGDRLASAGWHATVVEHAADIANHARSSYDAIAVRFTRIDDYSSSPLAQVIHSCSTAPIVARVASGDIAAAALAARSGASHVVSVDDFSASSWRDVQTLCRTKAPVAPVQAEAPSPQRGKLKAVFVDPASRQLLALARRVAGAEVTTLVVGPTGAGKEVLARVLHDASPRAQGPFVAFNCAALPEHLVEDLLFGHEKGAFTGAHRDHRGLFEQAQGGTLFLDEIGDMPVHLQARLLRVLQERQVMRLGGTTMIGLDVRVVAATATDLKLAIAERRFREDLFYRISTFQLRLMPLALRPADILPLAYSMLERHAAPGGGTWLIDEEASRLLLSHPWPGNVRELDNVIRRSVVLAEGPTISRAQLMFDEAEPTMTERLEPLAASAPFSEKPSPPSPPRDGSTASTLPAAVRDNELRIVRAALAASSSRDEAARQLGISPRTLRHKLAQWRQQGLLTA